PSTRLVAGRIAEGLAPDKLELLDAEIKNWRVLEDDELDKEIGEKAGELRNHIARITKEVTEIDPRKYAGAYGDAESAIPDSETELASPAAPPEFDNTIAEGLGRARVLGYGDLLITRQTLLGYEDAEIAHVENVMNGEFRERTHRFYRQTEKRTRPKPRPLQRRKKTCAPKTGLICLAMPPMRYHPRRRLMRASA
ncbi:MAG: hypothetical protein O3C57_06575, partial [Verrucomicrobia bacterium]|nr:hypothetical protein [Verrucomicrobiota bacterium]